MDSVHLPILTNPSSVLRYVVGFLFCRCYTCRNMSWLYSSERFCTLGSFCINLFIPGQGFRINSYNKRLDNWRPWMWQIQLHSEFP
jgi:hypothetical protein